MVLIRQDEYISRKRKKIKLETEYKFVIVLKEYYVVGNRYISKKNEKQSNKQQM